MKPRVYFFFVLYSFLFLFYPGESVYFRIFAYNRDLIAVNEKPASLNLHPIPYITTNTFPFITAEGVYIADLPSFTPIHEQNTHTRLFPASTTKILTALV